MARRITILAVLLLHVLVARAHAVDVQLAWTHPGAAAFLAFVAQPTLQPEPHEAIAHDPLPDADGLYHITISGIDPAHEASVFLLAVDAFGRISPPSNIIHLSASELCGAQTCGDQVRCTSEFCFNETCSVWAIDARCDDGDACTLDFCDAQAGCVYLPAIGACDDGLDCTTDDTCIGGTCTGIDACPSGTHCDAETATCRPTAASTTTIPLASTTTLPTFGSTTTSTTPGTATCGDGVVDPDEQCDDGDTQWQSGEACTAECVLVFCGDTDASGSLSVTDALFILQAALGTNECDPSVCDVDHTLTHVSASDALRLLRFALGLPVELDCPDAQ